MKHKYSDKQKFQNQNRCYNLIYVFTPVFKHHDKGIELKHDCPQLERYPEAYGLIEQKEILNQAS